MRKQREPSPQFGEALRQARDARGLTREELAYRVGASVSSVVRWEGGLVPHSGAQRRLQQVLPGLKGAIEALRVGSAGGAS